MFSVLIPVVQRNWFLSRILLICLLWVCLCVCQCAYEEKHLWVWFKWIPLRTPGNSSSHFVCTVAYWGLFLMNFCLFVNSFSDVICFFFPWSLRRAEVKAFQMRNAFTSHLTFQHMQAKLLLGFYSHTFLKSSDLCTVRFIQHPEKCCFFSTKFWAKHGQTQMLH